MFIISNLRLKWQKENDLRIEANNGKIRHYNHPLPIIYWPQVIWIIQKTIVRFPCRVSCFQEGKHWLEEHQSLFYQMGYHINRNNRRLLKSFNQSSVTHQPSQTKGVVMDTKLKLINTFRQSQNQTTIIWKM